MVLPNRGSQYDLAFGHRLGAFWLRFLEGQGSIFKRTKRTPHQVTTKAVGLGVLPTGLTSEQLGPMEAQGRHSLAAETLRPLRRLHVVIFQFFPPKSVLGYCHPTSLWQPESFTEVFI